MNSDNPINQIHNKLTPPIDYNYSVLPYHELEWGKLELLCYELICAEYGSERCNMYGLPGQNQQGFDCYVRLDDDKYILFQCKKVKTFKKDDLKEVLKIWQNGTWYNKTKTFVLFSSNNLQDNTFLDEFESEKSRLGKENIQIEIWGSLRIDGKLRNNPKIVEQFFGISWRNKFCNPLALNNYLGGFLPDIVHEYIDYRPVQFYISRRLTNPHKIEEVYKGYNQPQRISLPNYISACLAENKLARIIIKADAAIGKSKELENLGFIYSETKNGLFPILIRLKNFHGEIDKYIESIYSNWKQIVPERLILLFDGLDEVPSIEFKNFVKKFNTFVQANKKTNIIATIRTNVFNREIGADIIDDDRLLEFYLNDIETEDIEHYLKERIPSDQQKRRLNKFFNKRWVKDLLSSPFYLSALTDLFLEDEKQLPANKAEIIEKIITYKIRKDDEKYGYEVNLNSLRNFATKLALYLTLTGKNTILAHEINSFGNFSLETIRRCSLFKVEIQDLTEAISFEHNNFQEYLAAISLSKLDWESLEPILFHTTGVHILKPKMFNTVNYLFTILPAQSSAFKNLFRLLYQTENDIFLKFEKDKLTLPQRMEIFKRIIINGKIDRIYYLGGDFRLHELCEFVNYSAEAFKFVLDELKITEENNHRYCLLDIIYYYNQVKLTSEIKLNLLNEIKVILSKNSYNYAVYDRSIDILTKYQFFNNELLELVKHSPQNNHKMVRSAIIKYIDDGKFLKEFKYVVESDAILTNSEDRISAGLEPFYLKYVLTYLNHENAIILLEHFISIPKRIKEITGYEGYSEEYRLVNQIYRKLGDIYNHTQDKKLYQLYTDFLIEIEYDDYKRNDWGDPSLFFAKNQNKDVLFWDYLHHKDLHKIDYFLCKFYRNEFGPEIINRYKKGKVTEDQVRTIRLSLDNPEHEAFQQLLIENFGDQFKFQDRPNWEKINAERETKNIELLHDHTLFLQEGKKVYQLIKEHKKDSNTDETLYELEYSERKEIQKKLNNTIILRAINDYKIKDGFKQFQNSFDLKGWEWYVFQNVGIYIHSNKKGLTPQLLKFAENYLIKNILPEIKFDTDITEQENGSYTVSNAASHLTHFFVHSNIQLEPTVTLEMLKLDYYGFGVDHHKENKKEKKIYQLVYERSDPESFKSHILENLQHQGLADRVITSQAAACLEYNLNEGLPYILQRLNDPKFSSRYKDYLINIIIGIADGPEVFEDIIYSISSITKEWQFKVCKYLIECDFELPQLKLLIENTNMNTTVNKIEVYWKFEFLRMAIKLGSKKATSHLFNTFYKKSKTSHYLNIKLNLFANLSEHDPEYLLKYCFQALNVLAPTFHDNRFNDQPEMLEETIRHCAIKSQKLFQKAIKEYEKIINTFIKVNPEISYLKWYERRLVKSFLTNAVSYENDEQAMKLIKKNGLT